MKTRFQKIGVALLISALICTWLKWSWIAIALLGAVGIVDLYLVFTKKMTISQWIHGLFPKYIDIIIMVSLLAFTWWIWGPVAFLPVMTGVIVGHLFWQE